MRCLALESLLISCWHATKRGVDKLINEKKNALGKLDTSDPDVSHLLGIRRAIDDEFDEDPETLAARVFSQTVLEDFE